MYSLINDFEKWLISSEEIEMNLQINIKSFEGFHIEKDLFLYGEDIVKNKLLKNVTNLYLKRIEDYVKYYITGFSFSNYKNLSDFMKENDKKIIGHFFDWFKNKNIYIFKDFISKIDGNQYDLETLYNVITYYDYLIEDTLEYENHEATLDFLIGFIDYVMIKAGESSVDKNDIVYKVCDLKEIPGYKINIEYLMDQSNEYNPRGLINDLKPANQQAFSKLFLYNNVEGVSIYV